MAEDKTRMGVLMSDEQTTEVAESTTNETEATESPAQGTDWVKESRKWEGRAKSANAELEELRKRAARLDELEEAQKTEAEKLAEKAAKAEARAAELEKSLAEKDRAILVERVAASKGVPARYLAGDSEEDLVASADQFLEDAKTVVPDKQVGYVGSQGTGGPTPPATSLDDVRERAKAFARKK